MVKTHDPNWVLSETARAGFPSVPLMFGAVIVAVGVPDAVLVKATAIG